MPQRLDWAAFWPFYLAEHNDRRNRVMHTIGTSIAVVLIITAIALQIWWFLLGALVAGYLFAWIGHFAFQKNRPATFRYPIKSFASDWRLWVLTLTGKADAAYEAHGIDQV